MENQLEKNVENGVIYLVCRRVGGSRDFLDCSWNPGEQCPLDSFTRRERNTRRI